MGTGEGAEELVEDLPSIGKQIIHEHEEIAEKFAIIMYLTGFLGLLSFYTSIKKHKLAKTFSLITLNRLLSSAGLAEVVTYCVGSKICLLLLVTVGRILLGAGILVGVLL